MMPVLFVGHGSPMNAIENNEYTKGWRKTAASFSRPSAILCISAHWFVDHTGVYTGDAPRTIHDFYGFPPALYRMEYAAPGSPAVAEKVLSLLGSNAEEDNSWGLDHGAWSVLHAMYPRADIPVFQLSINRQAPPETHYAIGRALAPLREENVLILGSGNIVHNLSMLDFSQEDGFDWAYEFDKYIDNAIRKKATEDIFHYRNAGKCARLAFLTPDHFNPLLYVLGASDDKDTITDFNHSCIAGSLSMTSYLFSR